MNYYIIVFHTRDHLSDSNAIFVFVVFLFFISYIHFFWVSLKLIACIFERLMCEVEFGGVKIRCYSVFFVVLHATALLSGS